MHINKLFTILFLQVFLVGTVSGQTTIYPKEEILFLTSEWDGERFEDGRPRISDSLIDRAREIRVEEAWQILHELGYEYQYEGNWKRIHEGVPVVGRALTAEYMPIRPDLHEKMVKRAHREGHSGRHLHWPINMLTEGDVYVADNRGREGSLMGDNLANIIYNRSGNGVIFDGFARDLPGLMEIDGFNAFVRDFGPKFLHGVLLMGLNSPVTIGEAIVLPGDLVIADRTGVVFIPSHMAERVISTIEFIATIDRFKYDMIQASTYGPHDLDAEWTEEIKDSFMQWLQEHPDEIQYSRSEIDRFMEIRTY
ncbi:MAG: hypothetical protein WD315_04460 [Balneolaceae bacterium]